MHAMGIQGTIENTDSLLAIVETMEPVDPEVHGHGVCSWGEIGVTNRFRG
jgi:hypothetical protein